MNPLATLRRRVAALFADRCQDLRDLSLEACEQQVRTETRSMMCATARADIRRHAVRQRFLRSRIAALRAEAAEFTPPPADNDVLRAMPPR